MRYLVVSSLPFLNSNRGIDVFCSTLLDNGQTVDHLVFPNYYFKKSAPGANPDTVTGAFGQLYSNKCLIPFHYGTMYWLPKFSTKFLHKLHLASVKNIDFTIYDVIVLESGKPVMLLDILPNNVKLVYRQSDPVWILMPRSKYLIELEKKVMDRADLIMVVRETFLDFIPDSLKSKTVVWKSGFNIPNMFENRNPYVNLRPGKNAVYVGFARIDYNTLELSSIEHPDVNFHIIGDRCLKAAEIKKLKQRDNVFIHGFMLPGEYIPYVANADFAIVPYSKSSLHNYYVGLTSKFLLFMYFGLPIVSYPPKVIEEFNQLPVLFANTEKEFSEKITSAKSLGKIQYSIDFYHYSYDGRKKELLMFLKNFNLI